MPTKPADVPRGIFWGTLAGFTSFVSHSGAPPYQMYTLPQKMPKLVFAGTSTILFAIVNAVKLIPYWALGQFNPGNLTTAALLSPVAVAGAFAGYQLVKIIPEKAFFRLVEVALAVLAVKLIIRCGDGLAMRVEPIAALDLRLGGDGWAFAETERVRIASHWREISSRNSRIWNGDVLICTAAAIAG